MASESNKEYSVNWKNHMSHVRKAFDNLLTSNELTDVTLCCEGKKIGAHKMLLSACSGYFRDTFKDVPCPHPVIFMFGVEYGVLSDILHFMYNGEVSVDTARLDMFLKTAQLLQISGLTDGANEKIIGENEAATATQSSAIEQNVDETFTDSVAPASSASDEARKGVKRIKTREIDTANKVMRQEDDQVFLSDVKSEPCELVNFEDPLEDPLLQTDQPNDSKDFFGAPGQSIADEEFKQLPKQPRKRTHTLTKPGGPGRKRRKPCRGCYRKLRNTLSSRQADRKVRKVYTFCADCEGQPGFCLECFNKLHD